MGKQANHLKVLTRRLQHLEKRVQEHTDPTYDKAEAAALRWILNEYNLLKSTGGGLNPLQRS